MPINNSLLLFLIKSIQLDLFRIVHKICAKLIFTCKGLISKKCEYIGCEKKSIMNI